MHKLTRFLVASIISVSLSSTAVFAASPATISSSSSQHAQKIEQNDPVKMLEKRKSDILQRMNEGKITKEEAGKKIERIDNKITKLKEFNKLTPKQKKDSLIKGFTERMDKKVGEGKLTRAKADKSIAEFKEKIEKWDGKGYPTFHKKDFIKHKKHYHDVSD